MNGNKQTGKKKSPISNLNISRSYTSLIIGFFVVIIAAVLVISLIQRGGSDIIPTITPPTETPESMTDANQETQESLPAKYTVVEGDTLWSISEKYYKSGYNWVDIAAENSLVNPSTLEAGTELTIPNVVARIPTQEEAVSSDVAKRETPDTKGGVTSPNAIIGTEYTVVKDDNLWTIAVRSYGDGFRWTEIAQANNLANPNLIHIGNKLIIPR